MVVWNPMRVLVFGTFDLLHEGHRFLLREAGKRGSVTVIVARDANVQRIKHLEPAQTESERVRAIRIAFPTYDVRLGNPDHFLAPVRELKPDLILLGYDQSLPPGVSEDELRTLTARLERVEPHHPHRYKSSLERARRKGWNSLEKAGRNHFKYS